MRGKQIWFNIGLPVFVGASLLAGCSSDGEVDASVTTAAADAAPDPSVGSELDGDGSSSDDSVPDEPTTTVASDTTQNSTAETAAPTTAVAQQAPANSSSLMIYSHGAAGGWAGNRWFRGDWNDDVGSLVNWDGEDVTVITIDGVQESVVAGAAEVTCDPIFHGGLPTEPALGYNAPYPAGYPEIGVLADWDPVPRTWTLLESPPDVYLEVVQDLLSSRGLDPAGAVLDQVVRVDLEGDGVDEILISANDNWDWTIFPDSESYSIVLLRKVIEGDVQTAILRFETGVEPDSVYFPRGRLAGFADLNGDAKMEILTQDDYYEGSAVVAWEYINDDLGPVEILSTGCGV